MATTTGIENMKNNGKYYLLSWEANGYDDSDGDVLVYNANTKSIEHNFWTTRGYCPCTYNASETDSLEDGFVSGKITEEEVKEAIINSEIKNAFGFSTHMLYSIPDGMELNIPVVSISNRGRGFKGEGTLLHIQHVSSFNYYTGKEETKYYAIIYKEEDKSLNKTLLHNIDVKNCQEISDIIKKRYLENCTIEDLFSIIRALHAQYSGSYCNFRHILSTGYCFPINQVDLSSICIDNTEKKCAATINSEKKASEYIQQKKAELDDWAKTKFADKGEEERNRIVFRTLKKHYREKLDKARDFLPSAFLDFIKMQEAV